MEGTPGLPAQFDREAWPWMKVRFASIFATKTRDEWGDLFYGTDACCVPVLNAFEAAAHPHNVARGTFAPTPGKDGLFEPAPAPKLSRTPGHLPRPNPLPGWNTSEVLQQLGFTGQEVQDLIARNVVALGTAKSTLDKVGAMLVLEGPEVTDPVGSKAVATAKSPSSKL